MFAILTLYPQPTHLEYGKSLAQAQHHPSIHPSTLFSTSSPNLPIPILILILNIPNITHSLACFIIQTPPPPPTRSESSISICPKKKIYPRRTSCITVAARSGFLLFLGGYGVVLVFLPLPAFPSQSIYFFFGRAVSFLCFLAARYHQCLTLAPFSPFFFFFFGVPIRFDSMLRFASVALPMALEKILLTVLLRGVCT